MLENLQNLKGKGRVIEWELNLQITSGKDHLHKMRALTKYLEHYIIEN